MAGAGGVQERGCSAHRSTLCCASHECAGPLLQVRGATSIPVEELQYILMASGASQGSCYAVLPSHGQAWCAPECWELQGPPLSNSAWQGCCFVRPLTRASGHMPLPAESRALVVQDASTLDRLLPALTAPEAVSLQVVWVADA